MNDHITGWLTGLLKAVAVAALLGSGATVLSTAQDVAVLKSSDTHNTGRLERIEDKLDRLIEREAQ